MNWPVLQSVGVLPVILTAGIAAGRSRGKRMWFDKPSTIDQVVG